MQKIFFIFIIIFIISLITQAFAQFSIGSPAEQISVEITVDSDGDAHVVHLIRQSNTAMQLDIIPGTAQNLEVKGVNGGIIQHAIIGDNMEVLIFTARENVIVEYDLDDVLFFNNGVWVWAYNYPVITTFYFPDGVNLIFINARPINIGTSEGIKCHGCNAKLQFAVDEPIIINEVKWEDQKFDVLIRTSAGINSFNFNQPTKSMSFDINIAQRFVTLIIPLELLWNPYEVYLNDEKIIKHEFSQNNTHVWINIRPDTTGTVQIVGTSVVPEFPLLLPFVLGITIVVGLQIKNRLNLR